MTQHQASRIVEFAAQPQQIMGTLMPAYRASATKRERNRRTIYTFQKRNLVDPFLDVVNDSFVHLNEHQVGREQ